MSDITLEGITELLREELKPVNNRLGVIETRLTSIDETVSEHTATLSVIKEIVSEHTASFASIEKTLSAHTAALERLLTEKKNREDEKIVSAHRFDRLEHWAVQVGKKLGIKLEL